jgi:heat shock protein HtpX
LPRGFFYFIFAFGVIYFVGKILETRADTASAAVLGKPDILAAALTKIGFKQLYFERYYPAARLLDWLRFDPHPPLYFRVKRLSKLQIGRPTKHALFVSLRDCIWGFLRALVGLE